MYKLCGIFFQSGGRITAVVKSDFIPKPVAGSAVLTTELGAYSSSSKQRPTVDATSSGTRGLQTESPWLRRTSPDDIDSGLEKNGFSSDATAAYDELVGNKRRASESSSDHSSDQASTTWKTSSEFSVSSSSQKGAGGMGVRVQRSSNQNIRVPQGIPGRDSVSRKPFINPSSSTTSPSAATADETDIDTNPLRRLRDSQSGFAKPVLRPTGAAPAPPRSTEALPPSSNNLNANLSFFDKLKEQEKLRKV